jgi:hypothetical protein
MEKTVETTYFTKDRPILMLAVLNAVLALGSVLLTILRLGSHDFKIPIQYIVNDGSVLQTSNWYSLYSIALFSVVGTVFTIILARRLHKNSRLFAAGVLVVYAVITFLGILTTNALLGLVGRV